MTEEIPDLMRHYFVTGRVQGVFYRASAMEKARELELAGWVRNLPDGRVEAMACGTAETLQTFKAWLQKGPPAALVASVEELPVSEDTLKSPLPRPFEVQRTSS